MSINVFDEETMIVPVIKIPIITVPTLEFPRFYIVAPGEATERGEAQRQAVYRLEAAPDVAFAAWIQAIKGRLTHREHWPLAERWKAINELAEYGIAIPWYLNYDAALAAAKEIK